MKQNLLRHAVLSLALGISLNSFGETKLTDPKVAEPSKIQHATMMFFRPHNVEIYTLKITTTGASLKKDGDRGEFLIERPLDSRLKDTLEKVFSAIPNTLSRESVPTCHFDRVVILFRKADGSVDSERFGCYGETGLHHVELGYIWMVLDQITPQTL